MSIENLQAELTLVMGEIMQICDRHGYEVIPTLLLRHEKGASSSLLISNDSFEKVCLCITELGDNSERSDQSPREAILTLLKGDD